ncbi:hypothetical protein C1H46_043600 [Malus baccata]|uniref:Uncharacterized protein n=1 Tax=Malus baccata TaxID=106549 RepID=A0A540K9F7_MALBA|nr:hypothetical protein C1H46_043600 [Malus baccata]
MITSKRPPRQARLVVYNKRSNETSIWIVELSKVHAATGGGHHRGKVISSEVVLDFQPPVVYKPRPIESPTASSTNTAATKGIPVILKALRVNGEESLIELRFNVVVDRES